jgi:hypothetical protein
VPELALNDDERDAFTGHLDRVGVPQLVGSKASPNAGPFGGAPELGTRPTCRPWASARASVDDAEQGTNRQIHSDGEPGLEFLPAPVVHSDLAASSSLAATDEERTATAIEVCLT